MGKEKDVIIDWLEDVGYDIGYDLENFHEVDKLTVTEYIRKAYLAKDKQRELEIIKMDRENRIRKIVREEMNSIHEEAYLDHLRNTEDHNNDEAGGKDSQS